MKSIFPNQKHIIEEAFEVGGVKYYRFSDVFQLPYERGLMALAVYEEVRMRCTREYLEKHVEACRELLHDSKIDIYKLNLINEQLGDRLNLAFDAEHLYKLASVVFFDEKENPALYEADYCAKKIEHWKKHKDLTAFFFTEAFNGINSLLERCRFRFTNIFGGGGENERNTFGDFASSHIQNYIDGFEEWKMVLEKEGNTTEGLTLWEFLFKLDKAIKNGKREERINPVYGRERRT
ncbi:hypothetical protein [Proteiniphilum sp. X52]|uniref:hypothetical protein n=1 Tax=Proteiniphilum sp. X52 TaxID=2382159 RepID=UPI0011CDFE8C|nr:hypothetical protein [Proteiniphilum sp. X52]